jgi:hypothetical protein
LDAVPWYTDIAAAHDDDGGCLHSRELGGFRDRQINN